MSGNNGNNNNEGGTTSMYDRHITIFSPEGRLYQVEYAFRAVNSANITAIALKSEKAVCIVSQRKVPGAQNGVQQDKLLDTTHLSCLYPLTERIGSCAIGMPADCRASVYRARQICAKWSFSKGYPIPLRMLATKIGNVSQIYTQHAYMRLLACSGIVVGIDEEMGPTIYKFDPAGWCCGYKAAALGAREQETTNTLEKVVRKSEEGPQGDQGEKALIDRTLMAFQAVIGEDVRGHDLEVGVCSTDNPKFRILSMEAIDDILMDMVSQT